MRCVLVGRPHGLTRSGPDDGSHVLEGPRGRSFVAVGLEARFWERGGWWKALVFAAVYYGVYQLMGVVVVASVPESSELRGPEGGPMELFFGTVLPIVLTSVLLVGFAASVSSLP